MGRDVHVVDRGANSNQMNVEGKFAGIDWLWERGRNGVSDAGEWWDGSGRPAMIAESRTSVKRIVGGSKTLKDWRWVYGQWTVRRKPKSMGDTVEELIVPWGVLRWGRQYANGDVSLCSLLRPLNYGHSTHVLAVWQRFQVPRPTTTKKLSSVHHKWYFWCTDESFWAGTDWLLRHSCHKFDKAAL